MLGIWGNLFFLIKFEKIRTFFCLNIPYLGGKKYRFKRVSFSWSRSADSKPEIKQTRKIQIAFESTMKERWSNEPISDKKSQFVRTPLGSLRTKYARPLRRGFANNRDKRHTGCWTTLSPVTTTNRYVIEQGLEGCRTSVAPDPIPPTFPLFSMIGSNLPKDGVCRRPTRPLCPLTSPWAANWTPAGQWDRIPGQIFNRESAFFWPPSRVVERDGPSGVWQTVRRAYCYDVTI